MSRFPDRLSDRMKGKDCDEIIKDFKNKVDKDRKMFFDRDRDHHGMRIMDDPRISQEFRQHFNRVPQPFQRRYPSDDESDEVDHGRRRNRSGQSSNDGASSTSSGSGVTDEGIAIPVIHETTRSTEPSKGEQTERPKRTVAKSNTGDLSQPTSEERLQRSSSAPPVSEPAPSEPAPTFVSSCEFTPNQPEPTGPHKPVVRNVPIFVEGRDGPLPRVDEEMRSRSSTPVRPQAQMRSQSPSHGRPQSPRFFQSPRTQSPANQRFPQKGRDFEQERAPQAQPAPKQQRPEEHTVPIKQGSPQPQGSAFTQSAKGGATAQSGKGGAAAKEGPQKEVHEAPKVLTEYERNLKKIEDVNVELETLAKEVETFSGQRGDKRFLYLDEMLTRLLIRLDDVAGEKIRAARKETIKRIQKYVSLLESKAESAPVVKSESQAMDVEKSESAGDDSVGVVKSESGMDLAQNEESQSSEEMK